MTANSEKTSGEDSAFQFYLEKIKKLKKYAK